MRYKIFRLDKIGLMEMFRPRGGFSILEAVLASGLFALIGASSVGVIIGSAAASIESAGKHAQAAALAERGMEAVNSVKERGWGELAFHSTGISTTGGRWSFLGEGTASQEGDFSCRLEFAPIYRNSEGLRVEPDGAGAVLDEKSLRVVSVVEWTGSRGNTNNYQIETIITDKT